MESSKSRPMALFKTSLSRRSPLEFLWGLLFLTILVACGGKTDETAITIDEGTTPTTTTLPGPTIPPVTLTSPAASPTYSSLNSLNLTGTCVTGNTVRLSGASTQTFICLNSTFSFSVTAGLDGSQSYSLLQEDSTGQTSAAIVQVWVRDTSAASAPIVTSPSSDPYTSADSSFSLNGSCETGSTVSLAGASTTSQTCTSSSFSFTIAKGTDGTYDFTLKQTDPAGNISPDATFRWVRDSSLPNTPVLTSPLSDPSYSNDDSITISGSCVTGHTVSLAGAATDSQVCSSSLFSFIVSKFVDATYDFSVSQTNPNTMLSSATVNLSWIRDTVAPSAVSLTSPTSSPTYSSNNITLIGTCENDATVALSGDDTQSVVCANSSFQFTVSKATDQTYNFALTQTDLAGNTSSALNQAWIRDSNLPPAPTIATPAANPYSSKVTSVTISGSCTTGYTVTLGGDVSAGDVTSPASSLTQTCASSTYSFSISKSIDGTYNFTLKQTSLASIDSSDASWTWILDSTAPNTTLASTPADPNLGTNATFQFSSTETGTFACSLDGAAYAGCTSPHSIANLANGSHTLLVRATDTFGNTDATPASYTWTQLSGKTLALYHFDSGDPLLDSGSYTPPYQNSLTNTGTTNSGSGQFSQSQSFNGSNQFLAAPHSASFALMTQRMTAEAFVQLTTLPSSRTTVIAKMGASGQFGWDLGFKKQGSNYRLSFLGSLDGTTTTEIQSGNFTAAQEAALTSGFVHVAVTWDQGAVKIYFNGTQMATGTLGSGVVALFNNASTPVTIGAANGTQFFNGRIDEVRISQVVRWSTGFTAPSSSYMAD